MSEIDSNTRPFNEDTLLDQIGIGNVLAISGGRVGVHRIEGECWELDLPVSSGYLVRITLAGDDTYTVQRILKRRKKGESSPSFTIKGEMRGVYCDQVGEVAYYASCYKSYPDFNALDANRVGA